MLVSTKVQRGYKFRIVPKEDKKNPDGNKKEVFDYILQNGGCARKVYNLLVAWLYQKLTSPEYTFGTISSSGHPKVSELKESFEYLKDVDSQGLSHAKDAFKEAVSRFNKELRKQKAIAEATGRKYEPVYTKKAKRLLKNKGIQPTFRDLKGMPKFHRKKDNHYSYTTSNQLVRTERKDGTVTENFRVRLEGNLLYVPKLDIPIKLIMHREIPKDAVIKNVTLSMMPNGTFYASIQVEFYRDIDDCITNIALDKDTEAIDNLSFLGLDYSQKDFYVDDQGKKANYPKYYRKAEAKLARLQRQLSHMKKDSKNYKKQLDRIRELTTKITNQRRDFCHQLSRKLANQYDVVAVEDIDLRAMGETLRLAKNLHDNGFGMFRVMLAYKLREKGSFLVKVARSYASTKTCSHCKYKNPDVKLGVTEWVCPKCGCYHNRDWNAAFNIAREGRKIFPEYVKTFLEESEKVETKRETSKRKRQEARHKKKVDENSSTEEVVA